MNGAIGALMNGNARPRAHIVGWGKYVPARVLTNDELAQKMDTSDEWIRTHTGIGERRLVEEGETTATMAVRAARQALSVAGLNPTQLDLIIVATITPDYPFPSTACLVQDALGATRAAAFDLAAGCTGFVYGLSVAANLIAAGAYQTALVIGAETLSAITDWEDRNTCILFGDGAGAVIVRADTAQGGVLSSVLGADGSGANLLYMPAGGSRQPTSIQTVANRLHYAQMKGREVFRFAVQAIPDATQRALDRAGLALSDVKLIVPHQANQRIIEAAVKRMEISPDLVFTNLDRYGNTSAASIPIALCEAVEQGRIQRDDVVVCVGFGAGLTWGATAIRWSVPPPAAPQPRRRVVLANLRYLYAMARSLLRRIVRWLVARVAKE